MKAVILAGGLGTRLRPFTEAIPKPLLPVGEKSVMEIQIERLRDYGFDEIYLATNYKSQYIENYFGDGSRYGVKLTISKEEKRLGTAGPLLLLKNELTEPFLTLVDFKKMYDSLLTVSVKKEITPFAFGNIDFDGDFVTNIQEKPDISRKPEIFNFFPQDEYFGMLDMLAKKEPITKHLIGLILVE